MNKYSRPIRFGQFAQKRLGRFGEKADLSKEPKKSIDNGGGRRYNIGNAGGRNAEKRKETKKMKVHINYRALYPYTTNAKGEAVYHWYTEDIETSEIRISEGGFLQIRRNGEWSCFEAEQIHIVTIKQ